MDAKLLCQCKSLIKDVDAMWEEMSENERDIEENLFRERGNLSQSMQALECFYDFMHLHVHRFTEDEYQKFEETKIVMERVVETTFNELKRMYDAAVKLPFTVTFYNKGNVVIIINTEARTKDGAVEAALGCINNADYDTIEVNPKKEPQ